VDDQIQVVFAKLKDCVGDAEKKDIEPHEMQMLQSRFEDLVSSRLDPNLRDLKGELVKIGNQREKKEWRQKHKDYKGQKAKMVQKMDMLRQTTNRDELGLENGGAVKGVTNDEILQQANNISNSDVETMKRLVGTIAETQEIGENAVENLHAQTEQIERINQDVHGFRGTVKRGGKLLAIYKRRLMTDRLIWIFLLLIVLGVIGLVIWTMVDPEGSAQYAQVPEAVKPPTPDEVVRCYEGDKGSGCASSSTAAEPATASTATAPAPAR